MIALRLKCGFLWFYFGFGTTYNLPRWIASYRFQFESVPVSTPPRKYHSAAGLSATSEQRLHLLEQRFRQLDDELSVVEATIQQRFPMLGLGRLETDQYLDIPNEAPANAPANAPADAPTEASIKRAKRSRPKPR